MDYPFKSPSDLNCTMGRRATTVVLGPADAAPIGELRTGSTLPDGAGALLAAGLKQ